MTSHIRPRLQTPLRCICRAANDNPPVNRRRGSLSMHSLDSELSNHSCSSGDSLNYSSSSNHSDFSFSVESIDDLVAEATKKYIISNKQLNCEHEPKTIHLAVKRLNIPHACKTYYELRILASKHTFVGSNNNSITSVLIGYAQLEGVDHGMPLRRYTFQDSQHLFLFCEQFCQKGRFEDAAF